MKSTTKIALAAAIAVGGFGLAATSASADIVCNGENECWHVRHHHYDYRPEWGVVVHPDHWRWGAADHYRWREHTGRGYWRNGVWIRF
ncbi:MAG: hypothetical protein JSS35_20240 [Proteobacteria bacterium]|nr:hypothetical protein [Pseudomonadota bacterium]